MSFVPQFLSYDQAVYSEWGKEEIIVKATIMRGNDKFGPYRFLLTPSEYDDFKSMKGTFTGFSLVNDDIIINLLPTDIIYIESDNYDEVKEKFDKDYEEKTKKYQKEIEERNKKIEEEIEKTKAENKLWYRKIINFLKGLFK